MWQELWAFVDLADARGESIVTERKIPARVGDDVGGAGAGRDFCSFGRCSAGLDTVKPGPQKVFCQSFLAKKFLGWLDRRT